MDDISLVITDYHGLSIDIEIIMCDTSPEKLYPSASFDMPISSTLVSKDNFIHYHGSIFNYLFFLFLRF